MISNYQQITVKYLKTNYRRTILTIIGIVLSVALISSIGFFISGLQQAKIEEMKSKYGSFHLYFAQPDKDLISKIKNNPKIARSGLYTRGQDIQLSENLSLSHHVTGDQAMELLPYKLSQGRFPAAPNEIALEKWVLQFLDKKVEIGDQIIIKSQNYNLVGLIENNIRNQINQKGLLLTKNDSIQEVNSLLLVEINPKTNLRIALAELKQLSKKDQVKENGHLLFVLGTGEIAETNKNMYTIVYIIIAIVVIATIAVIYNSFQISVVERVKQFGLLRTIGSTPKQIRKLVFREATFLAIIAIPLGMLLGIAAIYGINIAFRVLIDTTSMYFKLSISPEVILISIVLGILSIYASAFLPALYASRISPLAAISSRTLIGKEKIKKRKSRIFGKIFGFEGELAAKNIKRNKRRYRITVFSILISVVLFITFSSFMDMSLLVSDSLNESRKMHFTIREKQGNNQKVTIDSSIIEEIESISTVQKIYKSYEIVNFSVLMDQKNEITKVQNFKRIYTNLTWNGAEKTLMKGSIDIYDPAAMEAATDYLKSGSIDLDRLNQENGVILINKNRIINDTTNKSYFGPIASLKVGDEIKIQFDQVSDSPDLFAAESVKTVKILAIVEDDPFTFRGSQDGLKMITTKEVARRLLDVEQIEPIMLNVMMDDEKDEEQTKAAIERVLREKSSLRLINLIDNNRQGKSAILLVKILLYGFVLVVSCIGCVNIVNTITTNIIIRKRELAMIKSIGLSPKGLKKMIVLEGLLYGIQGSLYGSLIALGLSYLIYLGLMNVRELLWEIPWTYMIIATGVSLIISYISVLSPLKRLEKENLIDIVREDF